MQPEKYCHVASNILLKQAGLQESILSKKAWKTFLSKVLCIATVQKTKPFCQRFCALPLYKKTKPFCQRFCRSFLLCKPLQQNFFVKSCAPCQQATTKPFVKVLKALWSRALGLVTSHLLEALLPAVLASCVSSVHSSLPSFIRIPTSTTSPWLLSSSWTFVVSPAVFSTH